MLLPHQGWPRSDYRYYFQPNGCYPTRYARHKLDNIFHHWNNLWRLMPHSSLRWCLLPAKSDVRGFLPIGLTFAAGSKHSMIETWSPAPLAFHSKQHHPTRGFLWILFEHDFNNCFKSINPSIHQSPSNCQDVGSGGSWEVCSLRFLETLLSESVWNRPLWRRMMPGSRFKCPFGIQSPGTLSYPNRH